MAMISAALFGLISRVLCLLPSTITGRVRGAAGRHVYSSLRATSTSRELRFSWLETLLVWGGNHPIFFAAAIGAASATAAQLTLPMDVIGWGGVCLPPLPKDFSYASFLGTVWSVQATLVALVYPIVISFVAIILQKRAVAKSSLSVYILDSAVLPAGISSLVLVAVMTVEYLGSSWLQPSMFVWAAVFNGLWLLTNLALTGYFLVKTVRFVQDEEGHAAFIRIAVNTALRQQLTSSLLQHLLVEAPSRDARRFPGSRGKEASHSVSFLRMNKGARQVTRRHSRSTVLKDVHLNLLGLVYRRWLRRAEAVVPAENGVRAPRLVFPLPLGLQARPGEAICEVERGPGLTAVERAVVNAAFVFGRAPTRILAPDVSSMLGELAAEVQSQMESKRYAAAREALRGLTHAHVTLLRACNEAPEGGFANAASVAVSPLGWGTTSYHVDWLRPYRPLAAAAVKAMEDDQTFFDSVAYVATKLVSGASPMSAKLVSDTLLVPKYFAYQMETWWVRQMQMASAGGAVLDLLPEPKRTTYERAVISFVGAWNSVVLDVASSAAPEATRWASVCNRAQAYASHMEESAKLVLDAVSRNDACSAKWFSDSFLKWWGNRDFELETGHLDDDRTWDFVRLSVVEQDWPAVQEKLYHRSGVKPAIDITLCLANLGLKRYWEALRLSLSVLLIEAARGGSSLALSVASSLLDSKPFHEGGTCEAEPLTDQDVALASILDICFGDATARHRLDSFSERLRLSDDAPRVPGWIYGGSVAPSDMRSQLGGWAAILMALPSSRRPSWRASKKRVEVWWRESSTLSKVSQFAKDLHDALRRRAGRANRSVAAKLRGALGGQALTAHSRPQVAAGIRQVQRHAFRERTLLLRSLQVTEAHMRQWSQAVGALAFGGDKLRGFQHTFCSIETVASVGGQERALQFSGLSKERLVDDPRSPWLVENEAAHVRFFAFHSGLDDLIRAGKVVAVQETSPQELVLALAESCRGLEGRGEEPVVLVPPQRMRSLRPYNWNREGFPQLPPGIALTYRSEGQPTYAFEYLNTWPLISISTTHTECFVVPMRLLSTLYVQGSEPANVLRVSFEVTGDNSVDATVRWTERLGPVATETVDSKAA